jgi:hypothetical protein
LVLLCASVTYAADFCITETSPPGLTYVGQNFKIPGKGKCKPWTGFVSLTAVPLGVPVHWYCLHG